jgi:hypothetical protein
MIKGMIRPLLAGKVLISGELAIGSDLSQQLNLNPPLFPLKTTSIQAIMRVELNDETTPKSSVLVEFGSIAFWLFRTTRMVKTRDPDVGNSSQLYTHPHRGKNVENGFLGQRVQEWRTPPELADTESRRYD